MADFDRFERLLALVQDRNAWQEALTALADFDLVALHAGPGSPTLSLMFELILPATASRADGTNAVGFAVVFHGVDDLAISRWGALTSYAAHPREAGGWQARLVGAESSVAFTFGSIGVDGVRYFRAGAL